MKQKEFYKIMHYDFNCSPLADGLVEFFTEDIESFEKFWSSQDSVHKELIEKFKRSKNGECVTDWYSSDPEYNIVQKSFATVYSEKRMRLQNVSCKSWNAFSYESLYTIQDWIIHFIWIKFKNRYLRLAQWKADKILRYDEFSKNYESCVCYGNPVLKKVGDSIETICYLLCKEFMDKFALYRDIGMLALTDELKGTLLRDIPGEAG